MPCSFDFSWALCSLAAFVSVRKSCFFGPVFVNILPSDSGTVDTRINVLFHLSHIRAIEQFIVPADTISIFLTINALHIFTWSIILFTWRHLAVESLSTYGTHLVVSFARYLRLIGHGPKTGCFPILHAALLWTAPHIWLQPFCRQIVPVIHHPVGETELPQVQHACLLHDFHSMATGFSCIHWTRSNFSVPIGRVPVGRVPMRHVPGRRGYNYYSYGRYIHLM